MGDKMFDAKTKCLKLTVLIALISMLLTSFTVLAETGLKNNSNGDSAETIVINSEYSNYLNKYSTAEFSTDTVFLDADSISNTEKNNSVKSEDFKSVLIGSGNKWVEYSFKVKTCGLYNISLCYKPIEDTSMNIRFSFELDGKVPYDELKDVSFSRIWVNANTEKEIDEYGDQLRPEQVEKYSFRTEWAENSLGLYNSPYVIYLSEGEHSLRISRVSESAMIQYVKFAKYDMDVPNYEEYIKVSSNIKSGKKDYIIEAENAIEKSHSTLAPTADNTNAGMSPISANNRIVNSFGKDCWKENGQWASWQVPESLEEGLYILRFRAKQDGDVGTTTYRKLLINSTLPFKEAESIAFPYFNGWQIATFGEDEPYYVYLKPGDVITLEATTGPMAESLNQIYSSVTMLNDIYQSIIMVTGATPDNERDYNIQKEIPTLLDDMKNARTAISEIGISISNIMGENNPKVFFINKFITLLDSYIENYRLIVPELSTFKSYIESYAGETYDFNTLPLELDTIMIMSPKSDIPKSDASFWKTIVFEIERVIYSFAEDYSVQNRGNSNKSITVWCSLGRDQAQSVRQIIKNNFTPTSGINVDFKISVTSLAEAILSGKEPDVSLSVTQEVPVDLAMRGQALDLTEFLNKMPESYIEQFPESSWIPFKYKDGIYAMPITQDFQMMFYRKDVFERLGMEIPTNWEEFYEVLRELQRNNFQVGIRESDSNTPGISAGIVFYETLLLQNGEEYFKNGLGEVNFESDGGKKAFTDWVKLYRDYDLETDFDLTSRFRSGEMPLVLTSYSFYQTLTTVAPEISGRWAMACIPATQNSDGSENKTISSTLTGTVILKGAEKRGNADAAFEFVSWWAGEDAQVKYSNAMEAIQGIAGRPTVANESAFIRLGWSDAEIEEISTARKYAQAIPQIPGTYIINRSLTNALRKSYNENVDPLRQLSIQCRTINNELARKRAEFDKNN